MNEENIFSSASLSGLFITWISMMTYFGEDDTDCRLRMGKFKHNHSICKITLHISQIYIITSYIYVIGILNESHILHPMKTRDIRLIITLT